MKAMVYTRYGAPDVLRLKDIEKPAPKAGEILIRVRAAEATKADCELRSLHFPVGWYKWPLRVALGWSRPRRPVLGGYFSGDVESVGASVTRFNPGDAVFGATRFRFGAYGEYLCLPEHYTLALKPVNQSYAEAAAVPFGGLNALHFMRLANIQPGENILINGAGGSIGSFAVQIAKAMGAEVTAVDSGIKEAMLRDIGADRFIDYAKTDFTEQTERYDVVFNMVAGASFRRCMNVLKPGGRYLMGNPRLSDMARSVLVRNRKALFAFAGEREEELLTLKRMIEDGEIVAAVDRVYPLAQAAEAHRRVESERRLGIVVLSLDDALP